MDFSRGTDRKSTVPHVGAAPSRFGVVRTAPRRYRFGLALGMLVLIASGCLDSHSPTPTTVMLRLQVEGAGSGHLSVGSARCTDTCEVELLRNGQHTVVATPADGSELSAWTGCDSVAGLECAIRPATTRTVTAVFDLEEVGEEPPGDTPNEPEDPENPENPEDPEDPEEPGDPGDPSEPGDPEDPLPVATGSLAVTFSGLPSGLEDLGHATLTSPSGQEFGLLQSTTMTDLPVGEYGVSAHGLEVCTANILPLAYPATVTITEDETAHLNIVYGEEGISAQGFRAVIRGIHSNSHDVFGYLTITEEGRSISVIGCFTFHLDGSTRNASIREGNPFDVYVEEAPVIWSIAPEELYCEDDGTLSCFVHLGGVHEFDAAEHAAFRAGAYYFYVEAPPTHGHLVAQIGSELDPPAPAAGGELVVDIGTMPPELAGYDLCFEGRFTMQEDSFYGMDCLDLYHDAGQHRFDGIYSGEYSVEIVAASGGTTQPGVLLITGSPAQVRAGEVETISVEFIGE